MYNRQIREIYPWKPRTIRTMGGKDKMIKNVKQRKAVKVVNAVKMKYMSSHSCSHIGWGVAAGDFHVNG